MTSIRSTFDVYKKLRGNSSRRTRRRKKDKKCASGHTIGLACKTIKIFTIDVESFIVESKDLNIILAKVQKVAI